MWRGLRTRERARLAIDAAQARIARNERDLSVLMRSVQELIFRTDAQGVITFQSDAPAVGAAVQATQAGRAQAAKPPAQMPGINRVEMPPVSPEDSEAAIRAHPVPANLNPGVQPRAAQASTPAQRVAGDAAPAAPASVAELARALRHDVDLIYEHVRNNVEYVPLWGVKKGAFGAILDNQGTAFDQAALMVELLRQSGYTANYVVGPAKPSQPP